MADLSTLLGFDVLTAVVMKGSIFLDITRLSPLFCLCVAKYGAGTHIPVTARMWLCVQAHSREI
jgi:hypothetical protein